MKKLLLIALFAIGNLMCSYAQNDTVLYIENCQDYEYIYICLDKFRTLNIYAEVGCTGFRWYLGGQERWDNPLTIESQSEMMTSVEYHGCNIPERTIWPYFRESRIPNSFSRVIWKRNNDTERLEAIGIDSLEYPFRYEFLWSTGETTNEIEVTEPGTYTCEVIDACGTAIRTFIVRNNVELTSASCDLETGYNMLEWETNAQQATYVQSVNIYYDYDENCTYSELIANVPYNTGSCLDITHDSYQYPCQYHVVAVGNDGVECPLRSYWCRTISLSDLMGTQGTQTLQWTSYTTERDIAKQTTSVLAYQIYDVINGEAFYKATVGSFANTYNYDPSDFNGHGGVAAVLDGAKDGEAMAFARTRYKIGDPDGTEENHQNSTFVIYPNPATSGVINIRAMEQGNELNLTIVNSMGQVIYSGVVNGVYTTPRLTPGIYTVIADGNARKVVVQ